jgi:hypothetical protein
VTATRELRAADVSTRPWLWLAVACVALVAVAEMALLWVGTSYLGAGYNAPHIEPATFVLAFVPSALVLDTWLVLLVWLVALPLLSRVMRSRLQLLCAAALLAGGAPAALAGLRYNVYSMLGAMFSVALVSQSSTLGPSALFAEVLSESPALVLAALPLAIVAFACLWMAGRIERRIGPLAIPPPPLRAIALGVAVSGSVGAGLLAIAQWKDSPLLFGFEQRLSGATLSAVVARLSDFDSDGVGAFDRPGDPAPFDASIHPYAVDVPGDGRDQNGIGGDHPVDFDELPEPSVVPVALGARPHVLLVYLESFRFDLIGARLHGQEVTPFLNRLAREGGSSAHAYVHSPWTLASRTHLWSGRLWHAPGDPTLVDDFKSRGYTVAWLSGQDDSYGDSARRLGAERADLFYDARQDLDRRTSRSIAPISLQVSWKTLTGHALDYLAQADPSRPLFVYLNVVDTHYPYWHAELDPILGTPPLDRRDIRAAHAREVFEAYANTAANVDRAVQTVFEALRARIGAADLAVIVTADHGETFYEHGALGHGQSLDALETRVPFIVWGLGGDWREPIAASDVRQLLLGHLDLAGPPDSARPHFVSDPEHRLLQYAPSLEQPRYIALRGSEDLLLYDFADARFAGSRGESAPVALAPDDSSRGNELIWRWESLQRRALEPGFVAQPLQAARVAGAVGSR